MQLRERPAARPLAVLAVGFAGILSAVDGCAKKSSTTFSYDVPLQPGSPWPKFRRDSIQDALSPVTPVTSSASPWAFQTGNGIFSSPIVAANGTIYVGSGDSRFYALNPDGTQLWQKVTGNIIDSAALLDNTGTVYFGSGDGYAYALDAATGTEKWSFLADDPSTIDTGSSYIRWFEGNVAINAQNQLIIPNDNNVLYGLDPKTGNKLWSYTQSDECWSLAAVNVSTGDFFFGNDSVYGAIPLLSSTAENIYALHGDGSQLWTAATLGSTAASPLLTSDGAMIIGSFDGFVRAYDQKTGMVRWEFPTRDHIYASPALLPDGTVIQAGTDGTVYAINPVNGQLVWNFDILNPIRSSPAIDAEGNIYMGTGGGQLLVLTKDGERRWAMNISDAVRNDVNSSPALGTSAIYIGAEDGNVYAVPYDYCLHGAGLSDSSCQGSGGTLLPATGTFLWYTDSLGTPQQTAPTQVDANQALAFSLYVRQSGHTEIALIDSSTVSVNVTPAPATPVTATVSGDRRFITLVPTSDLVGDTNGNVTITITGSYLENFTRTGLVFSGGTDAGTFSGQYQFALSPNQSWPLPLAIPSVPSGTTGVSGDPAGVWELYRLAAPLPTILPSYNEIGFDSLHFLAGMVEGTPQQAVAWVVGGTLAADQTTTIFDPTTQSIFPVVVNYTDGRVTFLNQSSFSLEALNAQISFDSFRLNARVDDMGNNLVPPELTVSTNCGDIPTFGAFLSSIGFCNPQTDELVAFGTVLMRPFQGSPQTSPAGVGTITFAVNGQNLTATLTGSSLQAGAHIYSVALIDEATETPIVEGYALGTTVVPSPATSPTAPVQSVTLALTAGTTIPATARAYLLVDTYPVARQDGLF